MNGYHIPNVKLYFRKSGEIVNSMTRNGKYIVYLMFYLISPVGEKLRFNHKDQMSRNIISNVIKCGDHLTPDIMIWLLLVNMKTTQFM